MIDSSLRTKPYTGRLAPTPTGFMHLGHARTFWTAQERALAAGGTLLMRIEDLDADRCRKEFVSAALEDLAWFGLVWEGEPVIQSQRVSLYRQAFDKLKAAGFLYPCTCSRQDVLRGFERTPCRGRRTRLSRDLLAGEKISRANCYAGTGELAIPGSCGRSNLF